jgi:hypothetical protein
MVEQVVIYAGGILWWLVAFSIIASVAAICIAILAGLANSN